MAPMSLQRVVALRAKMVAGVLRCGDGRACEQKNEEETLDLMRTFAVTGCEGLAGDEEERRRHDSGSVGVGVLVVLRRRDLAHNVEHGPVKLPVLTTLPETDKRRRNRRRRTSRTAARKFKIQ